MEEILGYLPQVWLFLIGFFLLYYVVTDGADLGIGVLSLFCAKDQERGLMMDSIASVWHGHQTWLVLLGGMLFGAFPDFYASLLSALYLPIMLMLFGLILRGVAFEFRANSERKKFWGLSFGIGSLITALSQGLGLGALLGGTGIIQESFQANIWGWLRPFALVTAVGVVAGYVMLGANYLILKTSGPLQEKSFRQSKSAALFTLLISAGVHIWVVYKYPFVWQKWTNISSMSWIFLLLVLAVIAFLINLRSLWQGKERAPFFWNVMAILFSFSALSISMYPNMIPSLSLEPVTVQQAAASTTTLAFMLIAMIILLPVILVYTSLTYKVFRGKIQS